MGLVASMDMTDNVMLRSYKSGKGIFVDRKSPRELAERMIDELEIATPGVDTPVGRLSGGNVQKVLLGREIACNPSVLIVAYPCLLYTSIEPERILRHRLCSSFWGG